MSLQKNIATTMNQVVNQISSSTKNITEAQRKLEILKSSINTVVNISPDDIIFEYNVRHKVDEESPEFEKLCESIKTYGLLKNIVAELQISDQQDSYKLVCIAGHRRLTALKHLGFKNKIPCLIKQYNDGDRVGAALSENLNREGLNCIDIANGYQHLVNNNWTIDQIALHFEKNKKTIARFLKLAELPEDIKNNLQQNEHVFTNRVIFNDILAKNKLPGEIRKAIERRISSKNSTNKTSRINISERLEEFFKKNKSTNNDRELVISALKFLGMLK